MSNVSSFSVPADNTRLTLSDAEPSDASKALLQARRLKLRRIVASVIGGATLLMCAGLVQAAMRSHSERMALAVAPAPSPPSAPNAVPAVAEPVAAPSIAPAEAQAAATAEAPKLLAAKPVKKVVLVTHPSKGKRVTSKTSLARH